MLDKFKRGNTSNRDEILVKKIRSDFPILNTKVNNNNLIWFDNGATTQKPKIVIDEMKSYSEKYNANVHRSPHTLSKLSTEMFDKTRQSVKSFINAASENEIIFTKGTTEGMNLITNSFVYDLIKKHLSLTVVITEMEHHANIVPWHILRNKMPFVLDYINFENDGKIDLNKLEAKFISNSNIKVLSITHISNVLGTINPIKKICELAHKYGIYVVIDGAQGIPHFKVDVQDLGCDFYIFSSHKMFGPTGIGVVYGKYELLKNMPVWQGGGSMIKDVQLTHSIYLDPPVKFEPGTPAITEVIGFGSCIRYLNTINWSELEEYENRLMNYTYKKLKQIPDIFILGDTNIDRVCIFSFIIKNIDMEKLVSILDINGIATRYGHHCAQPTVRHYGLEEVLRISLTFYNTYEEIDKCIDIIKININKLKK